MIKKTIYLIFCSFFLILLLGFSEADTFAYIQNNNSLTQYYFTNNLIPFSNFSSTDTCSQILANNFNNPNQDFSLNMKVLNLDCSDRFLYNSLNYLLLNKKNLSIIYNNYANKDELANISKFSEIFNISMFPEPDYANFSNLTKKIFIGNSADIQSKTGEIELSNSFIYIDDMGEDITIYGKSIEIASLLTKLENIYNTDFLNQDCVILTGCEISLNQSTSQIYLSDIMDNINSWTNDNLSLKDLVKIIGLWKS